MNAHTKAMPEHVISDHAVESSDSSSVPFESTGEWDSRDLERALLVQKMAFDREPYPDLNTRKDRLKTLYHLIEENAETLAEALNRDFGCRAREETEIAEIIGSLSSIKYQIKNLKRFMRPDKRRLSIWFQPARGHVELKPLGVIGVMAPWNYSLHLTIAPIAAALAAGNRVMAKMSELTPHTTRVLMRLVRQYFSRDTLEIVDGGVEVAQRFSALPFNHLLFTGSTQVGVEIAKATAKNLTPVTLELSGKSPVVVGKHYDVKEAARRVVWGKCFNAGQTCVAPDYIFVPRDKLDTFIEAARQAAKGYYPSGVDDKSYTSIINGRHCNRIQALIDDAELNGAKVISLLDRDLDAQTIRNKIPPTLIIEPGENCLIYSEEIFGPVLPVFVYDDLNTVLNTIKLNPDPLALYIFSKHQAEVDFISKRVQAGNVAVNDTLLEYIQNDLPFGGVGKSGMGKYHGKEGFESFSNKQATFFQAGFGSFTGTKFLYPPYGRIAQLMLKLLRLHP